MAEDNEKKRRPLTQSEKFKNYCLGIAALTALILGLINILKGEPTAEKAWATLRDQTNALTETVNKLTKQVIFLQAHENGRTAAKLELKLEEAEKKIARLQSTKPPATKGSSGTSRPVVLRKPQKKCRDGFILAEGRCRRVHRAVAKKMAQDEVEKAEARRRLLEEKKKRLEAERRKRALMKQMTAPAPPPKPLPKLPTKLDEVDK